MSERVDSLVFDTGPLRHLAIEGWLGVLKFLAGDRRVVVPESVESELKRQVYEIPVLQQVLDAPWITIDRSDDLEFVTAFARYANRLVAKGDENLGECGVLALGEVRGFEVVLDDAVPRQIAIEIGIQVTATLPLLCQAIREGRLTVPMVEHLADDLIAGEYYLPFGSGGFRAWALEQGHIDYN